MRTRPGIAKKVKFVIATSNIVSSQFYSKIV